MENAIMKKIITFFLRRIFKIARLIIDQERWENIKRKEIEALTFKLLKDPTASVNFEKIHNPFNDKTKIKIGKESKVFSSLELFNNNGKIEIGEYSYLGPDTRVSCSKSVTIGNRVLISHNVNIYDNNSHPLNSKERHEDFLFIFKNGYQQDIDLKAKPIIIEDDVWIGFNCIILKGVTIGRGAIIGAGTLITKNVPPFAIVIGNPAKIIRYTN